MCVFLYFLLLSLSVYFLFFSVVGFPFRRQFFSDAPSSFFCLIDILLILLPILLKPHSFSLHKSAFIHTKRYVRHVWDMYWTNFTSLLLGSLLLCYFVENSESAGRKKAFKCSLIWAPSTRIRRKKKWGFKNVQIRRGQGLLALFTRRESNPAARRITLALAHFVCFTRRVYKAGSGYPSAFGDNFPRA